ncbi:hypothetical protein [Parvimonas micra]|uniref:hypothetical protein n=1 Tax=Parvimonas micra TaxID=33033 RepID=UPI00040F393B|nr:hypothetical protein [Parvimonas micra]
MLTREIDFFGKTLKVNVSSIIPLKYNFEFKKDLNDFLNKLLQFGKKSQKTNKKFSFEDLDFEMLNSCIEVAYTMLKYANNDNFNYKDYEDYLSNYEFTELAVKSMEIATLYVKGTKPTFEPRVRVKKNKGKKGR